MSDKQRGGARPGAGRPKKQLDEGRVLRLLSRGHSMTQLGIFFNVSRSVIKRIKNAGN